MMGTGSRSTFAILFTLRPSYLLVLSGAVALVVVGCTTTLIAETRRPIPTLIVGEPAASPTSLELTPTSCEIHVSQESMQTPEDAVLRKLDPALRMIVEGLPSPGVSIERIDGIDTVRAIIRARNEPDKWLTGIPGVRIHSTIALKDGWLLTASIPVDMILQIATNVEVLEMVSSYPMAPNPRPD